jgi:hypothetical protein
MSLQLSGEEIDRLKYCNLSGPQWAEMATAIRREAGPNLILPMNCRNCGAAAFKNGQCEYCGTSAGTNFEGERRERESAFCFSSEWFETWKQTDHP